jgi:D-alanyl-D-alanine carboxypeptidase
VLIRKRILAPLGLKQTFSGDEAIGSEARVHGYIKRRGRIIDIYPWYSHFGLADSGIHSTAGNLAHFLKSLLTTDDILSEGMRTEMINVSESGHPLSPYGIGIFVQRNPWGTGLWYANNGVDPGYHADMMYLPDQDLTIVLCANASQGMADFTYERLITAVVQVAVQAVQENRHQDQ